MSFVDQGNRGTNTSKASSTTITVSPNANVAAGQVLVVYTAWDNNNAVTPTGPLDDQLRCTDTAGNVYTELVGAQLTGGGTAAGAHACIFACKLSAAVLTTDTITITQTAAARIAKAVSLREFSIGAGKDISSSGHNFVGSQAIDPPSLSVGGGSGLPSNSYLLLHVMAAEAPSTDAYTWDANWTQITSAGTTGGVADTNMTVLGGFWIVDTSGNPSVDVQSDTADRDYMQGIVALIEVTPSTGFPFNGVLDNFTRADESPINGGGAWDVADFPSTTQLQVLTNQAAATAATRGGQYYGTVFAGAPQEAFVTCTTIPAGAGNGFSVAVNGTMASGSGQDIEAVWRGATVSGFQLLAFRYGADDETACQFRTLSAGNKLGIRSTTTHNEVWIDTGGGWTYAFSWSTRFPTASRRIGLYIRATTARADDFGGGDWPAPKLGHLLPILGVGA